MEIGWCIFTALSILVILYAAKMDYDIWRYFHDLNQTKMQNTNPKKYDVKMAREIIAFLRAYPCENRKERIAWIKEQISKKKDDFIE